MRTFGARASRTLALLIAGCCAAVAVGLSVAVHADDNPFHHVVPLSRVGAPPPQTVFIDQRGHRLRLSDVRGAPAAVAFVYTRCRDACPIITHKLGQVRALLGGTPATLIEITIDPSHDDLHATKAYARQYGMQPPGWLILTGLPADVDDFNRRMGVQAIASGPAEVLHNDRVALLAPNGAIAEFVDGPSWTPADLAAGLSHLGGAPSSILDRLDLALGAALAYCGSALSGRAGIGDLVASILVLGASLWLFAWFVRRVAASHS